MGRSCRLSLLTLFWRFEMLVREVVWMIFGISGVLVLKVVSFGHIAGLVAWLLLVFRPLLVEVGYEFVRDGLVGGVLGEYWC